MVTKSGSGPRVGLPGAQPAAMPLKPGLISQNGTLVAQITLI